MPSRANRHHLRIIGRVQSQSSIRRRTYPDESGLPGNRCGYNAGAKRSRLWPSKTKRKTRGQKMRMLPTPKMRAIPEDNKWRLLEPWSFLIKPDKSNTQNWDTPLRYVIPQGYEWDGASKPWMSKALFVLPSCHWKLVVPSLEHDIICDEREWFAKNGVSSAHAARHFRRQCVRYKVNEDGFMDTQQMYWAVRIGGPQWEAV